MLYQYLIRNENKLITHGVWVIPTRGANKYKLATNLPMAILHQFFDKNNSHNIFDKADSHRILRDFIRFFERIEFRKYGYPSSFTYYNRTNVKLINQLRNVWFDVPTFRTASPTFNNIEYYFLRTDFESMMDYYPDIMSSELMEIKRMDFEYHLENRNQQEEYVEHYFNMNKFYTSTENHFQLYVACNDVMPLIFILGDKP